MAVSTLSRTRSPLHQLGKLLTQTNCSVSYLPHQLRACHSGTTTKSDIDPESGLPFHHPEKGTLMYAGKLSQAIKGLKLFSLSTSFLAVVSQPLILASATDDFKFKAGLLGTFSVMVMSTPVMVQYVTKKYVTDVYYNSDSKIFTLAYRSLFLRRKEFQYEAKDVKVPLLGGMFTTHMIKGRPFFIELSEFRSKQVYIHMVGYDKPMDDPSGVKKKKKFGLWENEEETILNKELKKMQEKRREMDASALKEDSTEMRKELSKDSKKTGQTTEANKKAVSGV